MANYAHPSTSSNTINNLLLWNATQHSVNFQQQQQQQQQQWMNTYPAGMYSQHLNSAAFASNSTIGSAASGKLGMNPPQQQHNGPSPHTVSLQKLYAQQQQQQQHQQQHQQQQILQHQTSKQQSSNQQQSKKQQRPTKAAVTAKLEQTVAADRASPQGKRGVTSNRVFREKRAEPIAPPRRWTTDEDELLRSAVLAYKGRNWKLIAEKVPGRSHVQCLQRWRKALDPVVVKGPWTEEEDVRLMLAVAENPRNWGIVSRHIQGRTAKQCRERYHNHLDPTISKHPWSKSEDDVLISNQRTIGNRWAEISKLLPGRTENSVKLRWKSLRRLAKRLNNGNDIAEAAQRARASTTAE
jgi:hypothetical protein